MDPDLRDDARALTDAARSGALGTLLDDGTPYVSRVDLAPFGGDLILWISDLAVHAENLRRDPRCSVLIGDDASLAAARTTLVGRAELAPDPEEARRIYLEAHPKAAAITRFSDFHGWIVRVQRVRHVAGFGRMGWVGRSEWADDAGRDEPA